MKLGIRHALGLVVWIGPAVMMHPSIASLSVEGINAALLIALIYYPATRAEHAKAR